MNYINHKLFLLLCLLPLQLLAQVNPKQGYIITLENDTVAGVIDYRSEVRNTHECIFQKAGSEEWTVYKPADIKGYRLYSNGAYYVTKTVDIGKKRQEVFAEYLLKGGVSLYYIATKNDVFYYFEGEDGRTGLIKERDFLDYNTAERRNIRRHDMDVLSQIFHKSNETVRELWETNYDRKSLTLLTRRYSEQYCGADEECVQFLYDEKKTSSWYARLYVGASMKVGSITPRFYGGARNSELKLSESSPNVSVGCELFFPRLSRYLTGQICLDLGYLKAAKDSRRLSGCAIQTQWGVACRLTPAKRYTPIVRGGVTINRLTDISAQDMDRFSGNDRDWRDVDYGFYIGGGIDVAVNRHILRFSANYEYSSSAGILSAVNGESLTTSALAIRAGIIL